MLFDLSKNPALSKLDRKLKKLQRDPDLFIKDMVANKKEQVQKTINKVNPIKSKTKNKFTIVSAIYNVSKYLDDYFESIVNQSVDFKRSIHIICVDDGSVDNSANIIKKWKKKYPNNIEYIYKDNGGQSTARNLGLQNVKTEWVTFIDPDDFISNGYFEKIDSLLSKNNIDFVSLPMATYREHDNKTLYNKSALSFCYNNKDQFFNIDQIGDKIQLSACNAVFKMSILKKHGILFNSFIKPNFEDGKFVLDYFDHISKLCYSFGEYYFYRSREDNSSTSDTQWTKKEKFLDVFKYGFIPLLDESYKKKNNVPKNIQRTFIYFAFQYLRELIKNKNILDILSDSEILDFKNYFIKCFSYIDAKEIMKFKLNGFDFFYKFAMIECFKKEKVPFFVFYIENFDMERNQLCIKYYSKQEDDILNITLDEVDCIPYQIKRHSIEVLDDIYFYEKRIILNLTENSSRIKVHSNYNNFSINFEGAEFYDFVDINKIKNGKYLNLDFIDNNVWLFMDKESKADDNAEHLYRYMKNNQNKEIYFALSRNSLDWDRLCHEGFNLLDFDSKLFKTIYKKSRYIISSHADKCLLENLGKDSLIGKKFIFLQHGVTKDNISDWLNNVNKIDGIVSATNQENDYFVGDNSPYRFNKMNTIFSGFPRHDYLLEKSKVIDSRKQILIMPTWRSKLAGKIKPGTTQRYFNFDFENSDFYKNWNDLFNCEVLKNAFDKYGYSLKLVMHPNLVEYLHLFDLPEYIQVDLTPKSYQEYFCESSILLTDYSSVAFEMAYLNKSVIYFQFDAKEIFNGSHTYKKGYFEYENDGFGPVVDNINDFNSELINIIENNGQPLPMYLKRMQDAFKFKDGRCCERVYNAILALDHEDNHENLELAHTFLNQAYEFKNYALVRERAENILLHPELNETDKQAVYAKLAESYVQLKDWDALELLLTEYCNDYYVMKLLAMKSQWEEVLNHIGSDLVADEYFALRMSSLFNLNKLEAKALDHLHSHVSNLSEYEVHLSQCYIDYVNENWESLAINLENIQSIVAQDKVLIEYYVQDDLSLMQLLTYKNLNQLDLEKVKAIQSKKVDFILEKSNALSELNHIDEALEGFELAEQTYGLAYFNVNTLKTYMHCLLIKKNWAKLSEKLTQCINLYPNKVAFKEYFIQLLGEKAQWKELIRFYISCPIDYSQCLRYFIVLAYYRLGEIDEAYELLIKPTPEFNYDYWLLALEIYIQVGDKDKTMYCLKRMYAIFPENIKLTKERFTFLSEVFSLN